MKQAIEGLLGFTFVCLILFILYYIFGVETSKECTEVTLDSGIVETRCKITVGSIEHKEYVWFPDSVDGK